MVTCLRPGQARVAPDFQGMFIGHINSRVSTVQAGSVDHHNAYMEAALDLMTADWECDATACMAERLQVAQG